MSKNPKKHDKPVKVKEDFNEALKRIVRVDKKTVEQNIEKKKK